VAFYFGKGRGLELVKLNYKKKHIKKHHTTRTGIKLLRVQACVDHSTANPGATALNHFKYFNKTLPAQNDRLPERRKRYASAHIFVDKKEAIELVPLDEICFGANDGGTAGLKLSTLRATDPRYPTIDGEGNANLLCVHVEMCLEADGTIHPDTIKRTALVHQMLQKKFPQLKDTRNRFVRHFDVTGKNCPAPMVSNPGMWDNLLNLTDSKGVGNMAQESVQIQTGGLSPEMVAEIGEYFDDKKWWAQIQYTSDGENPTALTGGLSPENRKEFEDWLDDRGWWHTVV
jgi:N-acetylmuramoyl-L-alanine amidase CwlA